MKVGNDIVDIKEADQKCNWRRKGFIEKIFDQKEQGLISVSSHPFWTVWRMWSMKESAYKLSLQNGRDRFFNPAKIHCDIIDSEKGRVWIDKLMMHTKTLIHDHYIFTSATMEREESVRSVVFYLRKTDHLFQRKMTHQKALQHLSRRYQLDLDSLEIKKSNLNVPMIFYKGQNTNFPISLTHHGHFGAFSWVETIFSARLGIH